MLVALNTHNPFKALVLPRSKAMWRCSYYSMLWSHRAVLKRKSFGHTTVLRAGSQASVPLPL